MDPTQFLQWAQVALYFAEVLRSLGFLPPLPTPAPAPAPTPGPVVAKIGMPAPNLTAVQQQELALHLYAAQVAMKVVAAK
jgi:hypothetical protein